MESHSYSYMLKYILTRTQPCAAQEHHTVACASEYIPWCMIHFLKYVPETRTRVRAHDNVCVIVLFCATPDQQICKQKQTPPPARKLYFLRNLDVRCLYCFRRFFDFNKRPGHIILLRLLYHYYIRLAPGVKTLSLHLPF